MLTVTHFWHLMAVVAPGVHTALAAKSAAAPLGMVIAALATAIAAITLYIVVTLRRPQRRRS
jgi:hypothetical protein